MSLWHWLSIAVLVACVAAGPAFANASGPVLSHDSLDDLENKIGLLGLVGLLGLLGLRGRDSRR